MFRLINYLCDYFYTGIERINPAISLAFAESQGYKICYEIILFHWYECYT
jgi:hypothetical protein